MVLFGVGMRSLLGTVTPGSGESYMTFVLPGIIALTAVGAAIGGGSTWLNDRLMGIVKEYLVAPIPRLSILLGNAYSITTKVLVQSIIILIVGVLVGARLSSDPLGWLGGLLLVGGYGIGFAGIALATASKTDSTEGYHMMIFMLQLPPVVLEQFALSARDVTHLDADWRHDQPDNLRGNRSTHHDHGNGRYRGSWIPYRYGCASWSSPFSPYWGWGLALRAFKSAIK